jgi:hypothetical protein
VPATIFAPADGVAVSAGEDVWLYGQGLYLEDSAPTEQLAWRSSIDGELGAGPAVAVALTVGEHTIELTAGEGDRQGHTSIPLTVTPSAEDGGEPAAS